QWMDWSSFGLSTLVAVIAAAAGLQVPNRAPPTIVPPNSGGPATLPTAPPNSSTQPGAPGARWVLVTLAVLAALAASAQSASSKLKSLADEHFKCRETVFADYQAATAVLDAGVSERQQLRAIEALE